METIAPEGNKNKNWTHWIIGLLAFLLILQTGGILYYLNVSKDRAKTTRLAPYQYYSQPVQQVQHPVHNVSGRATTARTRRALQDPFDEDPFAAMSLLEDRMNRIFSNFFSYAPAAAGHAFDSGGLFDFMPRADLSEKENAYIVKADLPGLDKDKIDISVRGNLLTLQGVRSAGSDTQDEQSGYYAQERSYGSFARTIPLPGPVDEANVKADYKEGVLTITLPKAGGEKTTQKIKIQ